MCFQKKLFAFDLDICETQKIYMAFPVLLRPLYCTILFPLCKQKERTFVFEQKGKAPVLQVLFAILRRCRLPGAGPW